MSSDLLIRKSLEKIEYTFKWSGMSIESNKRGYAENIKYKIVHLINFLWVNTDLIGEVCWFIQGALKGKSLNTLTYAAPCITCTILANFKATSIFFHENEVNKLISCLEELENQQNNRKRFGEKDDIIKNEITFLNMTMKVCNFINWSVIVTFPLMPMTIMAMKYFTTNEIELILPLYIVYPFNAFDVRVWPFVYIHQMWSIILVVFETSGTDFLFYICSTYIRIQFRLLRHDIERVIDTSDLNGKFCETDEFNSKLAELIKWHQKLLSLMEPLETIYAKSTLINFITSSMLICLTFFNVTKIDDKVFIVTFLNFLIMSLMQIFMLCFFGDLLIRYSMEVNDAMYNSKWYLSEASIAKKMNIVQIRAQKPMKVTACGFADLNLKAFTKVLSTAWSYFALLNTVYSTPQH